MQKPSRSSFPRITFHIRAYSNFLSLEKKKERKANQLRKKWRAMATYTCKMLQSTKKRCIITHVSRENLIKKTGCFSMCNVQISSFRYCISLLLHVKSFFPFFVLLYFWKCFSLTGRMRENFCLSCFFNVLFFIRFSKLHNMFT